MSKAKLNSEVTDFLDRSAHPLRTEIEALREIIIKSNTNLSENIKWNAPNYRFQGEDRITMKLQPPKQIQIVFHRGAKTQALPENRLIADESNLLSWKANDRAVATFRNIEEIIVNQSNFTAVLNRWLKAASR